MKAANFSSASQAELSFLPNSAAVNPTEHYGVFRRGLVSLIAAGHFVNDSYTGFLSPLLPLLMARLEFPLSRAGMLATVLSASTSLTQPIFGLINDRINRRIFVFIGPLITGLFMCGIGYAPSYWLLLPLLMLCGLGSATFHPSAASMVSRVSGPRKEWGMSLFITAGNIGYAMSPLFVVPVVTYLGFSALPLLVFPALLVAFLLFRKLPHPATLPLHLPALSRNGDSQSQRVLLSLHLGISILRSVMITGFAIFIPVYMHSRGHSLFSSGATVTVFQSIGAIGSLVSGHFAARIDRRRIIIVSLLAAAPLLASFIYFSGWPALLALALSGILLYFSFPLNIVMAQELYPHRSSMVSALMIGVSWGTAGLFMTPLGFLAEKFGLQNALLALVASGVVAAFIAAFLPKDRVLLDQ